MNATPESKPKRAPKPVPAPLGTSASGRKRYRATMQEAAEAEAHLEDRERTILALRAERDAALSRAATYRKWALYFTPFVFFTMDGVVALAVRAWTGAA